MPTKIDIISNALVLIGHSPISSLDPDQGAGATVANIYDTSYEQLLTETVWRFTIKQQQLNRLSAEPLNRWKYAFQIPTDSLAIYNVYPRSQYQIYEDNIFSNQEELAADYAYKVDETRLPGYFVEILRYKLAADFAISVTNDTIKNQLYSEKFLFRLPVAMAADARAHPQIPILDQPFTDVRINGGSDYMGGGWW